MLFQKVIVASDHAGYSLKQKIVSWLEQKKIDFVDLGPADASRVDYPDYADKLSRELKGGEAGLLICGSGQGMAMRSNKYSHIRAALCWDEESSELSRAHNNANVLCLGSRLIDHDLVLAMIHKFFNTKFEGGRHATRVEKIGSITTN